MRRSSSAGWPSSGSCCGGAGPGLGRRDATVIRTSRGSTAVFVSHELLRRGAVEERAYQVNIARACLERSTLVVLPTGMGKTVIAAIVIAEVLRQRGGRILFLAPTKPLVEQHAASMRNVLVVDRITLFTGEATAPEDRELLWRENKNIVSTPDVVPYQHDLQIERIPVEAPDVSKEIRTLLQTVVDEQVARLKKLGFLAGRAKATRKDLLAVGNEARARLDSGVKDGRLYGAMTAQAIAMKADHAIELAETQGLGSLRLYFGNMEKDPKTQADVQV